MGITFCGKFPQKAIANKKDAHKEMRKNRTEENKARYVRMRNRAKRAVAKAMKEEAVQDLKELDKVQTRCLNL